MIDPEFTSISLRRQCELLKVSRSSLYYQPTGESEDNLRLMRLIDQTYTDWPFYGARRMAAYLRREGYLVNVKRVRRLMGVMGLVAIYPHKRLSAPGNGHKSYPYLLKDVQICRPNQVWCADITYIPVRRGCAYLVAVMDWYSRYVLSWALSSSLNAGFCVWALKEALALGRPEIFNTDQGSQFTSAEFIGTLEDFQIAISMDGRGRVFDNIFIERLWRAVKYEEVFLHDYADFRETWRRLDRYFGFYCEQRPHQALNYSTPAEVYWGLAGDDQGGAEMRPVAGTPVALRAPSVPATVGHGDHLNLR